MTITIHLATVAWCLGIAVYAIGGLFVGLPLLSIYSDDKPLLQKLLNTRIWGLNLTLILIAWAGWVGWLLLILLVQLLNPETYT